MCIDIFIANNKRCVLKRIKRIGDWIELILRFISFSRPSSARRRSVPWPCRWVCRWLHRRPIGASGSTAGWLSCRRLGRRCSRLAACTRWRRCTANKGEMSWVWWILFCNSSCANLEQEVERNDGVQVSGEELQHGEDRVHDPVGQPLGVVLLCAGLDRFDRNVRGVGDADDVAEQLRGRAEHQVQGDQTGSNWK